MKNQFIDDPRVVNAATNIATLIKQHGKTVPAPYLMELLRINLDNDKLSDEGFREMVRNTLPIIDQLDYALAYKRLLKRMDDVSDAFEEASKRFEQIRKDVQA